MATYNFSREIVTGITNSGYNINNKERLDGEGNSICLYMEINEIPEFKGKFRIDCHDESCKIEFNFTLTSEQETTLNNIVTAHKNNT